MAIRNPKKKLPLLLEACKLLFSFMLVSSVGSNPLSFKGAWIQFTNASLIEKTAAYKIITSSLRVYKWFCLQAMLPSGCKAYVYEPQKKNNNEKNP